VEALVPRPDVAGVLQAGFVALAADCDDPEEEVVDLAQRIENAYMLPFVIVADANGQFLAGASGAQTPEGLLGLLGE
jgi:predicted NBD/HSP70 family sugar kinase